MDDDKRLSGLSLVGHYTKLLHAAQRMSDKLSTQGSVEYFPHTVRFGIGFPGEPDPNKEGNRFVDYIGFGLREVIATDIHGDTQLGQDISKAGCAAMLHSLETAASTFEHSVAEIVKNLIKEVHGQDEVDRFMETRRARFDERMARYKQVDEEQLRQLTPEQQEELEKRKQEEQKLHAEMQARRDARVLKRLATRLGEDTTLKVASETLDPPPANET